jgi:hypothetical protein
VLVFWGGLRGGGSEDLPVRFGAASARWCSVGGQVDTAVGAVVAAAVTPQCHLGFLLKSQTKNHYFM